TLLSHSLIDPSSSRPLCKALLTSSSLKIEVSVFIDSGADTNFMDIQFATNHGFQFEDLTEPLIVRSLNNELLHRVTLRTKPLQMAIDNHQEQISFYLIHTSEYPVVLGITWLNNHNPHIDWGSGEVLGWSTKCMASCLRSATKNNVVSESDPENLVYPDISKVPDIYHDLKEVFNKTRATSLPPHRPYDCAIDLLPGTTPPRGRLYSLSGPEYEAMQEYISEALSAGLIRPSSSPAGAGFFFVGKRDGGLRPCIDYRGLNQITIKNRYPLPLISSAFELLQGAVIFTKLDLRNAYHLVRIREGDEWKTAFNTPCGHYEYLVMPFGLTNAPAVFQNLVNDVLGDMLSRFVFVYLDDILIFSKSEAEHVQHVRAVLQRLLQNQLFVKAEKCEFHSSTVSFLGFILSAGDIRMDPEKVEAVKAWPAPENRKQLQRFLGFANFYRKFIRGYSSVAAPLHQLTSVKHKFDWSPTADRAFSTLKERFISAPILMLPDTKRQFIVEVDA
ncbi:hypothetical protein M9458_025758, partial [Cirrhinus mrigala]